MIRFVRIVQAELFKLNRSLVLLLAAAPPLMMMVMVIGFIVSGNQPETWLQLAMSGSAIWAYLLMPLTITALTALIASVEHGCGGWTWSLAQPAPKTLVFLGKAVVTVLILGTISLGVGAGVLLGGIIGQAIAPAAAMQGALPTAMLMKLLLNMTGASLLILAIQFTLAHAFRAFAVPIVIGIGGTFVSVVATSWQYGHYFPWLMPVNMLASTPERAQQALLTGGIGGVLIFLLASLWLARRDWR